tara:strand:+ start:488 stop:1168 length:681 start_codon:yes stop_codon:yes gene_type:complete
MSLQNRIYYERLLKSLNEALKLPSEIPFEPKYSPYPQEDPKKDEPVEPDCPTCPPCPKPPCEHCDGSILPDGSCKGQLWCNNGLGGWYLCNPDHTPRPDFETDPTPDPTKWLQDLYDRLLKALQKHKPWLWRLAGLPEPPSCPPCCSYADCVQEWDDYFFELFQWLIDHMEQFWDAFRDENPDGTWEEFLCWIGYCNIDNYDWPEIPPVDWPEDWEYPPFQDPGWG